MEPSKKILVTAEINGREQTFECTTRDTLADALRRSCGLTGIRLGCEHGVCGACTIDFDGRTARSCLMFAPQADGARIRTVEGLTDRTGHAPSEKDHLHPLQRAFAENFALQCGFCTPGFLMVALELVAANPQPTRAEIREAISGNICRCTGYETIVDAIEHYTRD
ncbi:(2Fe-2S)-binding protein [Amycolatopsis jejuensis]|uniref:(2Fe-2S)-binding protein n=1 Tax=Amycolatopsis jejuensis TaxID=330084 RepID=UPI000A7BD429